MKGKKGVRLYLTACGVWVLVLLFFSGVGQDPLAAIDGVEMLKGNCASCHSLTGPPPVILAELWRRKGPDLFYAGNKYKAEWLARWLQEPTRIRPAGMYYGNHIKAGTKGDTVDETTLPQHQALSADEARAVTRALMEFRGNSHLIKPGAYREGTISLFMGEMVFDKFLGCLACHQIEPGYGGVSGPELYTAAVRLQEDYLVSFMENPQAWDPKTFMPNKHPKEAHLQKLVHYLKALSVRELGRRTE